MWPLRKKPHKQHKWSKWDYEFTQIGRVNHRDCKCGAVQRHVLRTGEITIWEPDGLSSGLLDRGITRTIYEGL